MDETPGFTKLPRAQVWRPEVPGWFLQPPAVLPRRHVPSNTCVCHLLSSSLVRASGVRLQISSLENSLMKSRKDILWEARRG